MAVTRIEEFDTWRPGYGAALVSVLVAGTDTPASIFTDEALTLAAANPQALISRTEGGIVYGKFSAPLYVGVPYYLKINSLDETGVVRPPLPTLADADASEALATPTGGTVATALDDLFARAIDVRDHGVFQIVGTTGASASTNNASLVAAIAAAAAAGGGYVDLPNGTYLLTAFTVPLGVVLRGKGRGATTLQSTNAGNVATVSGARGGFARLTLDGVTLVGGSVGVYAAGIDQVVFDDAEVKRFETGIWQKGGQYCDWRDLYVSNCANGYRGHGDTALGVGGVLRFNSWTGGKVELCSGLGIEFKYVDALCQNNIVAGVTFDTNTGAALKIVGARELSFPGCQWVGNTGVLTVQDASPATAFNTVLGLTFADGQIDSGTINFADTYRNVVFRRMKIIAPAVAISAPGQNILVEDCEVANPTITGVATCWLYHQTNLHSASLLVTTTNAAVKAWATTIRSGGKVYLEAKVIGRQRDGINTGFYHVAVSAGRVGATLNYDTQTANFTVGKTLTGATSGATGRITADADSGASGALTLQDITGTFVDNEIITDGATGSALANGAISESACALIGSVTAIRAAQETDAAWDATFVANGPQIELRVTGNTSQTVEWTVDVDVVADLGTTTIVAGAAASIPGGGIDVTKNKLDYVSGTFGSGAGFTVGTTVLGLSSGATGTISANSGDFAVSGTFTLSGISGNFVNGETIRDSSSGVVATVSGILHA